MAKKIEAKDKAYKILGQKDELHNPITIIL